MAWDGVRWQKDTTLHTFDRVRGLCEQAKTKVKATTVAAIERLAKADRRLAATTAQWDANCRVLNTAGDDGAAAFDLHTGVGRDPDPLDYITKKTAAAAHRPGPAPLWTHSSAASPTTIAELQGFLQRYVGYCCTGFTAEHVFVFAYGTGANGKSTFINTIAGILGDYATVADMSTFIASNTEHHPTDLAKLMGARLVVAQETQKGRRWDETKIKALTGGDKITARFMRQDFFDFVPTFKLFICGNHKPRLTSVDEAMRRRLLLVPFTVQIPPAERDQDLTKSSSRVAGNPALVRRRLPGMAAHGPGAAGDRARRHRRLLRRPGYAAAVARRLHRRRRRSSPSAAPPNCSPRGRPGARARNTKPGSARALSEALVDRGFVKKRNTPGQQGFRNLTIKTKGY